jgi:hypothetical protein
MKLPRIATALLLLYTSVVTA